MAVVVTDLGLVARRRRRSALRRRAIQQQMGWERYAQQTISVLLLVGISVYGGLLIALPVVLSPSGLHLAVVAAGLFLRVRQVVVIFAYTLLWYLALEIWVAESRGALLGRVVVALILMTVMYRTAETRQRLGVQGLGGESLLLDLRERLLADGRIPALPDGWAGEAVVRNAYGQGFSGDFVLSQLSTDERVLEVVVTDVSGKGSQAGARALQLQGAMGGLLGPMPADLFLPAANTYLLRQGWAEGFATAVHLAVDLSSGEFTLGSAGHPPALRFHAARQLWAPVDGRGGPVLGVLDDAPYPRFQGRLERGDALVLYTDGIVESKGQDVAAGIQRMVGEASRALANGFDGLAELLVRSARAGESDDRAVVVVRRT